MCLLPSVKREGVFFVFFFHGFESEGWMWKRVEGFFHSSQNEEICGDGCILPKYSCTCILLQYTKFNIT